MSKKNIIEKKEYIRERINIVKSNVSVLEKELDNCKASEESKAYISLYDKWYEELEKLNGLRSLYSSLNKELYGTKYTRL